MTEPPWQPRSLLFNDLVDAAIGNEEIDQSLQRAHGIDAAYLRERCTQVSTDLWNEVPEATAAYDDVARQVERLARLHPLVRAARHVLTSTRRQYIGALGGLLAVMSAWFVYDPGPKEVYPHYPLLIAAMSLVAVALATQAPLVDSVILRSTRTRRVTNVVVVPVLAVAGIVMFCLATAELVPQEEIQQAGGVPQWYEAFAILAVISLVAVPFTRTLRETSQNQSPLTRVLAGDGVRGEKRLLVFASAFTWMLGIPVLFDETALLFGRPNPALLFGGLGLIAMSALIALLGFRVRPAGLLRQDLRAAEKRLAEQLTEVAILPFLRGEINKHTQVLEHAIDVRSAPGLGQLSDPAYLVSTAAADRVERLFASMPGGSIGLAGARGAGKTTLMESYCGGPRQPVRGLTTMVSAPVEYAPREFLLHLYAKVCREIVGSHPDIDGLDLVAALRRRRWLAPWTVGVLAIVLGAVLLTLYNAAVHVAGQVAWALVLIVAGAGLVGVRSGRRPPRTRRELRDLAAERLEEIRFQQSFSSTWSGAVKVPLGFDATVGGGRGLTRQPLHLPEIVDSLREFLALAAREHRVVIGIDELDKMESETAAEQFLNQIKSIFGVRGCYFLVSVSEDAMSSFERRGLPFRDVFDSTFDEIVWFEHLTAAESIASIDRRVLLMPLPFKQLCYALSGGLPRELIRVARLVLDAQDLQGPTGLSWITASLIGQEVARKARAVGVAVRRIDLEPDVGRFLLLCAGVPDVPADATALMRLVDEMLPTDESRAHLESTTVAGGAFLKLAGELACFLYYAATVLDYFDEGADEARWRDTSALHLLAQARQAFSTSTRVAWEAISSFRRSWGMAVVTFPAALEPVPVPH